MADVILAAEVGRPLGRAPPAGYVERGRSPG